MHGTIQETRFGRVKIHVLDAVHADAVLRLMADWGVERNRLVWAYGMTPGPEWDLVDEFGKRYRPAAMFGGTLYVKGPEAHQLKRRKTMKRKDSWRQDGE